MARGLFVGTEAAEAEDVELGPRGEEPELEQGLETIEIYNDESHQADLDLHAPAWVSTAMACATAAVCSHYVATGSS